VEHAGWKRRPGTRIGAPKIIVRIDYDAWVRGYRLEGETCHIAGVGEVPVAAVRDLMPCAIVAAVVTKGRDVVTVAHLGRNFDAFQRTALQWADAVCSTPGCPNIALLEDDHTTPYADCGTTATATGPDGQRAARRRCADCHEQKTRQENQRRTANRPTTTTTRPRTP
jgi:hypothetical protein